MSMTKRAMEAEREEKESSSRESCGCVFNWDDKFRDECPDHAAETARRMEEDQDQD